MSKLFVRPAARKLFVTLPLAATALAGVGMVGVAAADPPNTYTGCLYTSGPLAGTMIEVAVGAGPLSSCVEFTQEVSWSEAGVQGIQGEKGATGAASAVAGPKGDKGDAGVSGYDVNESVIRIPGESSKHDQLRQRPQADRRRLARRQPHQPAVVQRVDQRQRVARPAPEHEHRGPRRHHQRGLHEGLTLTCQV